MINITFNCLKSRQNKAGVAPVQMWVNTGKGDRKAILLPVKCQPCKFNLKKGDIANYCNSVRAKIEGYASQLLIAGKTVTADRLISMFKGESVEEEYKLSDLIKDYLQYLSHKVDITMTLVQYGKYQLTLKDYKEYQADKAVKDINKIDIENYSVSLHKKYKESTVAGYLKRTKCMFNWAVVSGIIKTNPFADMKIESGMVEVEPLTPEEVSLIENTSMPVERLEKVQDCFLFLIYTSLSYSDLKALTRADIKQKEGQCYITKDRIKTGVKFVIPLNDKAVKILEKYDYQLPVISNMKMNEYLKSVQAICGIKKNLHCHLARHTALTNFLNEDKLPIEVVSMIAGHSSTQMTKHYSSIREQTVLSYFK